MSRDQFLSCSLAFALLCSAASAAFEDAVGGTTLLQAPGVAVPFALGIGLLGWRFLEPPAWRRSPESGLLTILFWISATISAVLAALKFYTLFPLFFDACIILAFVVWGGVWAFHEEVVWSGFRMYCVVSTCASLAVLIVTGHPGVRFETFLHPNLWGLFCFANFCLAGLFRRPVFRISLQAGNLLVILAAQARSSLLSTMVAAAILFFFGARSWRIRKEDKLLAGMAGLFACLLLGIVFQEKVEQAFVSAFRTDDPYRGMGSGFSGRAELWGSGLRMIEAFPLFGVGPRMEGEYMPVGAPPYAHSGYISTFAQYGVIGGTLFFVFAVLRARKLWLMASRHRPGAAVGAAFVISYGFEAIFDPKLLALGNPASLVLLALLLLPPRRKSAILSAPEEQRSAAELFPAPMAAYAGGAVYSSQGVPDAPALWSVKAR